MTTATLARIRLNPRHRAVQRDLASAVDLHRTVMRLIPDDLGEQARTAAGLLFRLDEMPQTITLYVQSQATLDPARLPDGYGQADLRDLAPMFKALRTGTNVRYRIVASAIRRPRPVDGKKTPAVALSGAEADQWWAQRAQQAGLAVHTVLSNRLHPATSPRKLGENVYHTLTRFDGLAAVTDPDTLIAAILAGIGKGKPYGAGLLSLAPATRA